MGGLKGHDFLDLLENAGLFVIPLDEEQKWFRFHHLFQALLKRQLKKRLNAEEIVKLHQRASAWFDENGYIEEALWHAHEIGDKEAAARLVKNHRHDMMNQEQWYQLNRWLQKFPPEFIQEHPDLLMAKAWTYQRQARYSELFDILDGIEQTGSISNKRSTDDSILWGEVQALKSFQYYATGQGELSANRGPGGLEPSSCPSITASVDSQASFCQGRFKCRATRRRAVGWCWKSCSRKKDLQLTTKPPCWPRCVFRTGLPPI